MTILPPRGNQSRWTALVALIVTIGVIGFATLRPDPDNRTPSIAVTCVLCGGLGGPDLILNVVLFLPLGFALAKLGLGARGALGAGLAYSVGIEIAQRYLDGRSTTIRDVLCNAAGAWLGAILAQRLAGWLAPSRATSIRLVVATASAIGVVAATGTLLEYSPSRDPYFGHWSPKQEHLEHWTGTVHRAELDGIPVPSWRIEDPRRFRRAVADGFVVEVDGTGGKPTTRLGGILTVSDHADREVLIVGPRGTDLVVRVRRRAATLRLGAPEARFEQLMTRAPEGAPFTLRVEASFARTCATLNGVRECVGAPAAGSGWVLLFTDRGVPPRARWLIGALTFLALALPVGLLVRSVATAPGVSAAVGLALGMLVAALLTGLAFPTVAEWAGLAGGLVVGQVLHHLAGGTRPTARAAPARR